MPAPVPGVIEAEIAEEIRECFAMAAHAKTTGTEQEAKACFDELLWITQWQRHRKQR